MVQSVQVPSKQILYYRSKAVEAALVVDKSGNYGRFWVNQPWLSLYYGSVHDVIVGEADSNGPHARFAQTANGESLYLIGGEVKHLPIGKRIRVQIVSEAHTDKCAKARPLYSTHKTPTSKPLVRSNGPNNKYDAAPFEQFCETVPKPFTINPVTPASHGQVFLECLEIQNTSSFAIPGGGRVHIHPTPALTVLDIDRAGRVDKTRPAKAAFALNRDALALIGRLLSLRDIGGLSVVDCVGPLPQPLRKPLAQSLKSVFGYWNERKIEILGPSRFGLIEMSIERCYAGLSSMTTLPAQAIIIRYIWKSERALALNPAKFYSLSLPTSLSEPQKQTCLNCVDKLTAHYGNRLTLAFADQDIGLTRKH